MSERVRSGGLLDDLESFWKFDEASGNRLDSLRVNDLVPSGGVTQVAGKVGNAARVESISTQYLSVASSADNQIAAGESFSLAGWLYLDVLGGTQHVLNKASEYTVETLTGVLRWKVNSAGNSLDDSGGILSASAWHFLFFGYSASAQEIYLQVDNGTLQSAAATGAFVPQSGNLFFGSKNTAEENLDGRFDAWGFWRRLLTQSDRDALYNSGNGLEYPF